MEAEARVEAEAEAASVSGGLGLLLGLGGALLRGARRDAEGEKLGAPHQNLNTLNASFGRKKALI